MTRMEFMSLPLGSLGGLAIAAATLAAWHLSGSILAAWHLSGVALAAPAPAPAAPLEADDPTSSPTPDLLLEQGFPLRMKDTGEGYYGGHAIHTLVGDLDADPGLALFATGIGSGPLYGWDGRGSPISGWPPGRANPSVAYPAMGELSPEPGLELFVGYLGIATQLPEPALFAYAADGVVLSGWPLEASNFISSPATLADIDGDGLDEIFLGQEDARLHGYRADGTVLPGWPSNDVMESAQRRLTPAVGDLDGDGDLELVSPGSWTTGGHMLFALHHDATPIEGFPVQLNRSGGGHCCHYAVLGDVDADGALEIVLAAYNQVPVGGGSTAVDTYLRVLILNGRGEIEREIRSGAPCYTEGTAPALADLDGDGTPEIVLINGYAVEVWRGNGEPFPGWPVYLQPPGSPCASNGTAPVVGDVDGDGEPDLLIVMPDGSHENLNLFDRFGNQHPAFPRHLLVGDGAVPAIADIDGDGCNELVVRSAYRSYSGQPEEWLFAYDLGGPPHGAVEWGQFMGGHRHQGIYQPSMPAQGTPGVVALEKLDWTVSERCAEARVTVTRSCGATGPVSVGYVTYDGTAVAGWDYTGVSGRLEWADGDLEPKTLTIPLREGEAGEPGERFHLMLYAPVGASLGTRTVASIEVRADAPIEGAEVGEAETGPPPTPYAPLECDLEEAPGCGGCGGGSAALSLVSILPLPGLRSRRRRMVR